MVDPTIEIFALVGTSGTGKSHRASLLARRHDIDYIIDDGLLIRGSKILGGQSAKREQTRVAAVRRAIFADSEHAEAVKAHLIRERPRRLLIVATSEKMVHRIIGALDLPQPETVIDIHEIASNREMREARRVRLEEGKHVIPAPTFEVKKSFSGYLVDPLRFFYRSGKKSDFEAVIEKSIVRPTFSSLGKFMITDRVIAGICEQACFEVEPVKEVYRVKVKIEGDSVVLDAEVGVRYGSYLPRVLKDAQERAKNIVEWMTALNVEAINVTAAQVVRPESERTRKKEEVHGRKDSNC